MSSISRALLWSGLGCGSLALALQSVLSLDTTAQRFFSARMWQTVVATLGGAVITPPGSDVTACDVPYLPLLMICGQLMLAGVIVTLVFRRANRSSDTPHDLSSVMASAAVWWLIPGAWELINVALVLAGWTTGAVVWSLQAPYAIGLALAGWAVRLSFPRTRTIAAPLSSSDSESARTPRRVFGAVLLYAVIFTAMNWQLYRGLNIPHGDTAMYEEHLWNLLHGKGFRSYLDQGLFLGEHVQVIHLFLLPLYVLWPSHLLLELCQSAALAAGALPVFWMTRRATGCRKAAALAAGAYLLYPPMQFLDIAIDFKSFRPEAFFIPLLLFALDQRERQRWKTALTLGVLALLVKEDYTLITAPLGLFIAVEPWLKRRPEESSSGESFSNIRRRELRRGLAVCVLSIAWLLLATRVVMPWFRDGQELHYVSYFSKFGRSFGEVVLTMLTRPDLLLSELCSAPAVLYLMALFAPLAFLPLLSPARLAVAAPTLVLLCLNEIVRTDPYPRHHFQAPVVPVLIWAAIGGLRWISSSSSGEARSHGARLTASLRRILSDGTNRPAMSAAALMCGAALMASVTDGLSPLSLKFHDPGSRAYWRAMYVPGPRAEFFPRVLEQIPVTARVASTDFIHPRFTHFERSYDYSRFRRRVADYEDRVPHDTDYIVIDMRHYYSEIERPEQIRELRLEPEKWELLEDRTNGYFAILKRRIAERRPDAP